MKYALVGHGRMGSEVDRVAEARGHRRVALFDDEARLDEAGLGGAALAFEFTRPDAAAENVERLLRRGVSVVCGTTGWEVGPSVEEALREGGAGLIVAPNFSVGVNLFFRVVARAAELLGPAGEQHPYVLEAHHRGKRDAPSGTAARLGRILLERDPRLRRVVQGAPRGPVGPDELPLVSLRVGSEPGTHEVGFDGEHDLITLRHRARGRSGFALGAVLAAEWLRGRSGRHEFDAVLDELVERGGAASGGN